MEFLLLIGGLVLFGVFLFLKNTIWDAPRDEIKKLRDEIKKLERKLSESEKSYQNEVTIIKKTYESALFKTEKHYEEEKATLYDNYKSSYIKLVNEKRRLELDNEKIREALEEFESNISAIPYMSGMISEIETYGLERLALGLSWGKSKKRMDKVKSIREIRKDAQAMIEKNLEAKYQLAYLLELFPNLSDIIECEFSQLPPIEVDEISEYDASRDYLSKEEYASLTTTQRNQLALDRYMNSHNRTKWQIGRDYEQYVGYLFREDGYAVDNYGNYMGLEDLGRDIIASKDDTFLIVQCKYWSSIKEIHEKHITQLYGTMVCYCMENNIEQSRVKGVLVTNITLSNMAKRMANYLGVEYIEKCEMGTYPCIKCNVGHGEEGETKIYHLPFDRQYDVTKISKPGEFYAMTVEEAEKAGFRRTYKWFGNK